MHKILSIIIVYNPDYCLLIQNLSAIIDYVDKVIIWQNSELDSNFKSQVDSNKVVFLGSGQNIGLSRPLNYAWKYLNLYNYDFLLTLDQDSIFQDFPLFKQKAISLLKKSHCIVSPVIRDNISIHDSTHTSPALMEVNCAITSGMFLTKEFLNTINGYEEEFTVDGIDIDISLKAHKYFYKIFCINDGVLIQQYGTPIVKHNLVARNYSPFRLQGIFRNHIILYRKYQHPRFVLRLIFSYIHSFIPGILFIEEQKTIKLFSIIKGIFLGLTYKISKNG